MMMISSAKNVARVFVVDARPDDYASISQRATDEGLNLQMFGSGRAALRKDPAQAPELWVVNMRLPDMSGTDLLSMLRWRYPGVPVVLVSDDYRAEDEITARCSGAEMYLSKPLQGEWLASTAAAQR
jgi:DNA-binding response OmpR family regulator